MTHLGRILIVDDEPKIRSFIGRALTAAGYATAFAGSGQRPADERTDLGLVVHDEDPPQRCHVHLPDRSVSS